MCYCDRVEVVVVVRAYVARERSRFGRGIKDGLAEDKQAWLRDMLRQQTAGLGFSWWWQGFI